MANSDFNVDKFYDELEEAFGDVESSVKKVRVIAVFAVILALLSVALAGVMFFMVMPQLSNHMNGLTAHQERLDTLQGRLDAMEASSSAKQVQPSTNTAPEGSGSVKSSSSSAASSSSSASASASSSAAAAPTLSTVDFSDTVLIGDELMVEAKDALIARLPNAKVDALASRSFGAGGSGEAADNGMKTIAANLSDETKRVIIGMGNNDAVGIDSVAGEQLVTSLGEKEIYLIKPKVIGMDDVVNTTCATIDELAQKHKNVHVIDWNKLATDNPGYLRDKSHLSAEGQTAYVKAVADGVGSTVS